MRWKRLFFWRKKVDVQDVFNRVIDAKCYSEADHWMCVSLMNARGGGLISKREHRQARDEIMVFLPLGYCSLRGALEAEGLPSDFECRLAIYRNWKDRPKLK